MHSSLMVLFPMIELTVLGEPASKSNARRLVRVGRKFRIIKSKKALDYLDRLREQVAPLDPLLDGNLEIWMDIFYASRRPDLDESLILDGLQKLIYRNDRAIRIKHIRGFVDKENPRTEIKIREIP
jgi:Holliday junction resolvase RusA-like endonuclease